MKKQKSPALLIVLCILALCMLALLASCSKKTPSEGLEFNSHGDGTCSMVGIGTCTDTALVIPAKSPDGDSVTEIGKMSFYDCSALTSIEIPDSVTSIEWSGFENGSSLTRLTVSKGNKTYHSAGNCIIETATKTLIAGCNNSVIPADGSVTSIGAFAFYGCTSLASIKIPDSVTSIEEDPFTGCTSFGGCTSLTSMIVSKDNPVYHSAGNCIIETATKTLIAGCKNSIIPTDGSVTSIGGSAFYKCASLTDIEIPDSVTSLGWYAFSGCSALARVTIGKNSRLTDIHWSAFAECDALQYNTYDNAKYLGDSGNPYFALIAATDTTISSCDIHPDTKVIASCAFYFCSSLTSVTIPDGVTSIGELALAGCSSLRSVEIPNSVMSIGARVFSMSFALANITVDFGNPVYHSNSNCLIQTATKTLIAGCYNSEIPTDGSVISIGAYAFEDCYFLRSFKIPNRVISIGPSAFSSCINLTSITISNSVTSIGSSAFVYCSALTDITYTGTNPQWNAVDKDASWNYKTGSYTIHCTDGDIAK